MTCSWTLKVVHQRYWENECYDLEMWTPRSHQVRSPPRLEFIKAYPPCAYLQSTRILLQTSGQLFSLVKSQRTVLPSSNSQRAPKSRSLAVRRIN